MERKTDQSCNQNVDDQEIEMNEQGEQEIYQPMDWCKSFNGARYMYGDYYLDLA